VKSTPQTAGTVGPDPLWDDGRLHDPHAQTDKAARVEAMFDAIAPTYERVNAVTSFGQDARWRKKAVALANVRGTDIVLDVCCGTGDMIRTFAAAEERPRQILGLDFSAQMLAAGRYDGLAIQHQLFRGDGLRLPIATASVDIVSCAFGVRNFQDLDAGLREMHRVLRRRGRAVILEFAPPENPIVRVGYRLYTETILPRLASTLSRDTTGAYRYLPNSIRTFERRRDMETRLRRAGFDEVSSVPLNFGSVVIYRAAIE
jgi:demethylmenaquinone methyltransferase/2-methoxy-6-polyprenyl-1,4-benzoquinol methylase